MDERDRWDDIDDLGPPPDESGSFAGKVLPDLFRRALMTGIGSAFMTEDGIRRALGELKMPKEAVAYVVAQADRTKRELISTLARELRHFLNDLELQELVQKSLVDTTFEIHTTIRVHQGDGEKLKLAISDRKVSMKKDADADEDDEEASATKKKRPRKKTSAKKKASSRKKASKKKADEASAED